MHQGFSNNLCWSNCVYNVDAGSFQNCLLMPMPVLSLYSFDQLDRLVFLWQIAVWLNWFLNTFFAKRRQGISFPLLSYVSNKLEPLPMFYGSTVEHRQGSTISDSYESRSGRWIWTSPLHSPNWRELDRTNKEIDAIFFILSILNHAVLVVKNDEQ